MSERQFRLVLIVAVLASTASAYAATETVTYSYDARGRLIRVVHSGGPNNNVQTEYTYDKANNRKTIVTTGSSNPSPP